MKKILFLFLAFICSISTYAQELTTPSLNKLQEWVQILELDATQQGEVSKIEMFHKKQVQELVQIKNSDVILYSKKMQAINTNALAKFRNILRPEQLNIYQNKIEEREKEKVVLAKKMQAEGKSKDEIDQILNKN